MFFILSISPHQLFPLLIFSTEIKLVSKFLPKKKEVKKARHMLSRWLVALLSCNNLAFTLSLVRAYFCHNITRNNNINKLVLLYPKDQATIIAMTMRIVFFMSYRNEQATMIQFLHCIVREQAMTRWYCKGASQCTSYCKGKRRQIQPSQGCKVLLQWYGNDGPPRNNQIFICC
jgi:hypothetical protein